jgi:hypothetical protein
MLVAITVLLVAPQCSIASETIVFEDFSDVSAFTINTDRDPIPNPVFFNGRNVLRLITTPTSLPGDYGGTASAFLTDTIQLPSDVSFSTFFEFQISNPSFLSDEDGPGSDGLVFVIQTVSSTALGGFGIDMGYGGISQSLGIEFDTFDNGGWGINDPNGNHVGIDKNGNVDSEVAVPVAVRLNDGAIFYSWVDYDGRVLEVRLSEEPVRPEYSLVSQKLDLHGILGGSEVYVGFTAGRANGNGDHDIRAWTFVNEYSPIFSLRLPISIDIAPFTDPNRPNKVRLPPPLQRVDVVISSTSVSDGEPVDFDAAQVDPTTLQFGPGGAPAIPRYVQILDWDSDGDQDMFVRFNTYYSRISCSDTEATLSGETYAGRAFTGSDSVKPYPCP